MVHSVKMGAAALDVEGDRFVVRGVVLQEFLEHLQVDDYQREELTPHQRRSIITALEAGEQLPDLELGMRGEKIREMKGDNVIFLHDPVFVIDGQQRRCTVLQWLAKNPDRLVRLGAKVYFNTTREWEAARFEVLNTKRLKVSSNVLLRNARPHSKGIRAIWRLCKDKNFILNGRIAWTQNMVKNDMFTAMSLVKIVGGLHAHQTIDIKGLDTAQRGLDKLVNTLGAEQLCKNVSAFFDIIDECFGLKHIYYRDQNVHVRLGFLYVLARLLSDHTDFWQGPADEKFFMEASLRRKLKLFKIHDPEVIRLAGAGGMAQDSLYIMFQRHLNAGKRSKRLTERNPGAGFTSSGGSDESDSADGQPTPLAAASSAS
jgi:hypothetical protein